MCLIYLDTEKCELTSFQLSQSSPVILYMLTWLLIFSANAGVTSVPGERDRMIGRSISCKSCKTGISWFQKSTDFIGTSVINLGWGVIYLGNSDDFFWAIICAEDTIDLHCKQSRMVNMKAFIQLSVLAAHGNGQQKFITPCIHRLMNLKWHITNKLTKINTPTSILSIKRS